MNRPVIITAPDSFTPDIIEQIGNELALARDHLAVMTVEWRKNGSDTRRMGHLSNAEARYEAARNKHREMKRMMRNQELKREMNR